MKKTLLSLLGALLLVIPFATIAQCNLIPISLDERIDQSELIVEAEVIRKESFVSEVDLHIYTANYLKVYKVFKGVLQEEELIVLTLGGEVDGDGEIVTPSLNLFIGSTGTYFLNKAKDAHTELTNVYQPYSGPQACIFYDKFTHSANDVFTKYASIEDVVYKTLTASIGSAYQEVNKLTFKDYNHIDKAARPVIDSVNPLSVAAGIREVLEIRGKNFGGSQTFGKVWFTNASTGDPFIEPEAWEYISWNDTLIKLYVPHRAGTGTFRVEKDGVDNFVGLKIRFAQLNYVTSNSLPVIMINDNGNGGFTYNMSTAYFANTDAKESTERALKSWRDNSCINWENGTSTPVDRDFQDGVNNIRFGKSGELSNGVLAHTRNYYQKCASTYAFAGEIDLTFDPDKNWNYDASNPTFSQYDLESVAVHELGHAHQLGHVIDSKDFMHATVGPGVRKRILSDNNIEAGIHVMRASSTTNCNPMEAVANCELYLGTNQSENFNDISVYPNPFKESLWIDMGSESLNSIKISDIQGHLVFENNALGNINKFEWTVPNSLSNGLYIISIQNGENVGHQKVMLRK